MDEFKQFVASHACVKNATMVGEVTLTAEQWLRAYQDIMQGSDTQHVTKEERMEYMEVGGRTASRSDCDSDGLVRWFVLHEQEHKRGGVSRMFCEHLEETDVHAAPLVVCVRRMQIFEKPLERGVASSIMLNIDDDASTTTTKTTPTNGGGGGEFRVCLRAEAVCDVWRSDELAKQVCQHVGVPSIPRTVAESNVRASTTTSSTTNNEEGTCKKKKNGQVQVGEGEGSGRKPKKNARGSKKMMYSRRVRRDMAEYLHGKVLEKSPDKYVLRLEWTPGHVGEDVDWPELVGRMVPKWGRMWAKLRNAVVA